MAPCPYSLATPRFIEKARILKMIRLILTDKHEIMLRSDPQSIWGRIRLFAIPSILLEVLKEEIRMALIILLNTLLFALLSIAPLLGSRSNLDAAGSLADEVKSERSMTPHAR